MNCVCCHIYEFGYNFDWLKMGFLTLTFHLISFFRFLCVMKSLVWALMVLYDLKHLYELFDVFHLADEQCLWIKFRPRCTS